MPISGSASSAGRKSASTSATASARSTILSLAARKRRSSSGPAPSPLTTRIPVIVSSASAVETAQLLLQHPRALGVAGRVAPEADRQQRQRDQDDEREAPVEDREHDRDREDGHEVADGVSRRVEDARDELRVVRRAAHQVAGADAVVVGDVELEGVPVEPVADVRVAAGAVLDGEVVPNGAAHGLDCPDGEDRAAPGVERGPVAADDPLVDRLRDEEGRRDRRHLPRGTGQDGPEDSAALRLDRAQQISPGVPAPFGVRSLAHAPTVLVPGEPRD